MSGLVELAHPWIDSSQAPLYKVVFPSSPDGAELTSFCDAREAWARQARYPVAWVVDLSGIVSATAKQRRIFTDHLTRFEAHDVAYNQGSALVVPNAVLRGLVTAVFWMKKPRFPNECFRTLAEATEWAQARLPDASPPSRSRQT